MSILTEGESNLLVIPFFPVSFFNSKFPNSTAVLHSFKAIKFCTHLWPTFFEKCCLQVHRCCSSQHAGAAATRKFCLGSACTSELQVLPCSVQSQKGKVERHAPFNHSLKSGQGSEKLVEVSRWKKELHTESEKCYQSVSPGVCLHSHVVITRTNCPLTLQNDLR